MMQVSLLVFTGPALVRVLTSPSEFAILSVREASSMLTNHSIAFAQASCSTRSSWPLPCTYGGDIASSFNMLSVIYWDWLLFTSSTLYEGFSRLCALQRHLSQIELYLLCWELIPISIVQ